MISFSLNKYILSVARGSMKPMYSAAQIAELYQNKHHVKSLFKGMAVSGVKQLFASKYSRQGADKIALDYLGDTRLSGKDIHCYLFISYIFSKQI